MNSLVYCDINANFKLLPWIIQRSQVKTHSSNFTMRFSLQVATGIPSKNQNPMLSNHYQSEKGKIRLLQHYAKKAGAENLILTQT